MTEAEYLIDQSLRVMTQALDLIQFEVRSGKPNWQIAELAETINCVPGVVRVAGSSPELSEQGRNQLRWAIEVANKIMRDMERSLSLIHI